MTRGKRDPAAPPDRRGPSRRRLIGGALATALAAVLLPSDRLSLPRGPDRWKGKTRWIGHC